MTAAMVAWCSEEVYFSNFLLVVWGAEGIGPEGNSVGL